MGTVTKTFTTQIDSAGSDTYVNSGGFAGFNFSTVQTFKTDTRDGGENAMLKFDLSSIPSDAVCTGASLTMYAWADVASGLFDVYSLHSNVSDWDISEITWNDYKSGVSWPGSGGGSAAGTDYESDVLGTILYPDYIDNGAASIALPASRVQGWFGSANTNYGLTLGQTGTVDYTDWDARSWHSGNGTTASLAPKLSVEYQEEVQAYIIGTAEASLVPYAQRWREINIGRDNHQRGLFSSYWEVDLMFPSASVTWARQWLDAASSGSLNLTILDKYSLAYTDLSGVHLDVTEAPALESVVYGPWTMTVRGVT